MNRQIYRHAGSEWLAQDQQRVYEKLNEDDVIDIRIRYANGNTTMKQLAKEYRVSGKYIGEILRIEEFQHVPITSDLQGRIADTRLTNAHRGGSRKLTEENVREIRKLHDQYSLSTAAIGKMYNVNRTTIWFVIARKTWKHVI